MYRYISNLFILKKVQNKNDDTDKLCILDFLGLSLMNKFRQSPKHCSIVKRTQTRVNLLLLRLTKDQIHHNSDTV